MNRIVTLALIFFLTACAGNNFSWNSARQIKQGMPESEMLEIMGKPNAVRSNPDGLVYVWTHANGITGSVRTVSAIVKDGLVISAPSIPNAY